jgi:hypothetical protein
LAKPKSTFVSLLVLDVFDTADTEAYVYVTLAPALYLLRHLKQGCQIFVGA